ncbi:hypothetical protein BZB76_3984 [Actinomadura pelletieri DSM 43383]|uniref:Uncharacterized protein n=1 Tax=Actinomadura pelletieri DSM 43383 TaxID=1120940 RepID=A0A495QL58_9ACTN|nr:hypothetical protein BZB76_3984 [Actinomadura pelletieri DSM 43383]
MTLDAVVSGETAITARGPLQAATERVRLHLRDRRAGAARPLEPARGGGRARRALPGTGQSERTLTKGTT